MGVGIEKKIYEKLNYLIFFRVLISDFFIIVKKKMKDQDSVNNEEALYEKTDKEETVYDPQPLIQHKYASLFQIVMLGILFLFCRSTYVSYSNMISQLYQQEGYKYLGTISVMCVWVAFGLCSLFFAQFILQRISPKVGLMICSMNFPILVATGIFASACENLDEGGCHPALVYFVVILCSLICGTLGAVLWMSQSLYTVLCSPPDKLALYLGIFFSLNQSSQITANILSLAALGNVTHFQYFLILLCIAIFFCLMFITIPSVDQPPKKILSMLENFKKITILLKKPRIQFLSIYFTSTGVCIGFYTGYLYLLIQESLESGLSRSEVNVKTSYIFILLGVCSFFAGLLCGRVAGKISMNRLIMFSIILLEASIISSMFAYYSKNFALCFVTGALWGFTDSFLTTLSNILVKIECGSGLEGYALLRFCTCIGVLVTCVFSMTLSGHSHYAFLLIMFILQMIATAVVMELMKS